MRIIIEHEGYRIIIEPDHIIDHRIELHTSLADREALPRLELDVDLSTVPMWERVPDGH
jgi:hypothetical protein